MKATNFFFIVLLAWLLETSILAVQESASKDIGQERGPIRENVTGSDPDTSRDVNVNGKRTNKQSDGPTYQIIHKSVTSGDKESAPSDAFTADDLSQSWSNKGTKKRIYDIISKSITKRNKESMKDCDDEDECGSAIDVFNNDKSGDVIVKDKNSEETTYYEVISKSLVAKDDKTTIDAFSNGDLSSSSISEGNGRATYEIIFKSLDTRDKELGRKDCDDEDECGSSADVFSNDVSGNGAIPKGKDGQSQNGAYYEVISKTVKSKDNSELSDAFTGDESNSNLLKKENGGVTYEIISKSIVTPDKISEKDCDDEDDCGSANDVFINEGSGDKAQEATDKTTYQIISKSLVKKDESIPTDAFAVKESSSPSWNKGQTQVIYEILSKSVTKADKDVPNKNCDDEDECGSADDIFTNDGSGHFSERILTNDKSARPGKTSYYEVISKSIVENKESSPKDAFTRDHNDDTRYKIISKSLTTKNDEKLASKECADDDEDCALSNVGSGDDTFSARLGLSPPKHQLKPQVQSNIQPLFHGTSFLRLPALGKDAQDNIEIEMEIFPLEANGILLYNGWKANSIGDFISLSLQGSFVELSYDCRSGPAKIRTDVTVKLGEWNKIQFFRTGRLGSLTLNNGHFAIGMSPEPRSALTLNGSLMIGGVSADLLHEVSTNVGVQRGFTGYIRNLKIQSKAVQVTSIDDLETMKKNPCLSSPCQHYGQCVQNGNNYSCLCKAQFRGRHCSEEIKVKAFSFHKESYLRFNQAALLKILQGEDGFVTFFIITTQSKGMLIWEAQKLSEHFQRYATVGLTVGFISLSFNLGSGNSQIYSSIPVDDGEWHNITIARSKRFCYLIIDGQHKKLFSPINNGLTIKTTVDFYIGGIPNIKSATKGLHKMGFKGCLKNFEVNSKYLDFNHEYIASQNVGHCGEI